MATKVIFLTTTGTGEWTVPSDWNDADNSIEAIGGGAGGCSSEASANRGGTGGGGGAYARSNDVSMTPGATAYFSIGSAGGSGTGGIIVITYDALPPPAGNPGAFFSLF
jgi:hypothetical protein